MPCIIQDIESITSIGPKASIVVENQEAVGPDKAILSDFMNEFLEKTSSLNKAQIEKVHNKLRCKYRIVPSKSDIRTSYEQNFKHIPISQTLRMWMVKSSTRMNSGVLVVTITLSPHKFSCKYDCFYCPQETDLNGIPTQPRSYLSTEPAMLRAINTKADDKTYDFNIKGQFQNRIESYKHTGNIKAGQTSSKKLEIILSGGTWESYPIEYREQVINELYWSANTMDNERPMKTLEEEITENEKTEYRIIGLTLETRPDNITKQTITDYCRWGVTRIQIGVQHTDDAILKKINRRCYTTHTINAIRLLKQAGFKVVVHLMPDLPGSSPVKDTQMFNEILTNPNLQFDDVKIYPTAICKSASTDRIVKSKIADWYQDGTYKPYGEENLETLMDVIIDYKTKVNPWTRIQRIVRDIPSKSIESGYNKRSNLRQMIQERMKKQGKICSCIYCKEIGDRELDDLSTYTVVRKYEASEGTEYHITLESHHMNTIQKIKYNWISFINLVKMFITGKTYYWSGDPESYTGLFGFLRLRLDPEPGGDFIRVIRNAALIREVHVYGQSLGVGSESVGSQHRGFGTYLVNLAELIARENNYKEIAVIAGVGTREYYRNKCGYYLDHTYMMKQLDLHDYQTYARITCLLLIPYYIYMWTTYLM